MKRKPQGKRRVKRDFSKLQKCKLSVEQFLRKEDKSTETGGDEDGCHGSMLFGVKRKRRKELRKEKRKNKKAKMKDYYEGKLFKASPGVAVSMVQNNVKPTKPNAIEEEREKTAKQAAESSEQQENTGDPKQKEKAHHAKEGKRQTLHSQQGSKRILTSSTAGDSRKESVKITSSSTAQQAAFKKITKQQEVRKRALREANVEEEKEIKRLEKYLGMNKRKNKTTLPQSFTADGLDYILGILEPGASASGLYESDEDMDMTKERLEQLDGSESELSEDSQQEGSSDEDEQDSGEYVEEMEVIEEEECDEVLDQDSGNVEDTVIEGGEAENTAEEHGGNTSEKGSEEGSTKYIPPHQRESAETDDAKRRQELERLERNVKGLLNRFGTHYQRKMTFQFSMWDKFRDLANLSSTSFSNLVHLLVHLLKKKSLSLSVLKVIEFSELDKPKVQFLRQLLSKLLCEMEPEELKDIFGRISGIPKLGMLREGLKLFITHFLLKNALSLGTAEQAILLKERAGVAEQGMQVKDAKLKL
ncbi:UNVERIFIED_CONTAM: hypothetical protein FKN15_013125 [Acipenser sinensis]